MTWRDDDMVTVSVRLSPQHLDRLNGIALRNGMSHTETIRWLIDHTDLPVGPDHFPDHPQQMS